MEFFSKLNCSTQRHPIFQKFLHRQIALLISKCLAKLHHIWLLQACLLQHFFLGKYFFCSSICQHLTMGHDDNPFKILCHKVHIVKNSYDQLAPPRKAADNAANDLPPFPVLAIVGSSRISTSVSIASTEAMAVIFRS